MDQCQSQEKVVDKLSAPLAHTDFPSKKGTKRKALLLAVCAKKKESGVAPKSPRNSH